MTVRNALALALILAGLATIACFACTPPAEPGTWTEQSPPTHPSARYFHAMAYVGDDKVVLFGGYDSGEGGGEAGLAPAETWVYDVSEDTWTLMNPASEPPARAFHAMAHIGDDQAVLFGGDIDDDMDFAFSDTWVYDLSDNAWTQQSPGTAPEGRSYHAMAYAGWDQVLLFGGGPGEDTAEETWLYDLSADSWTDLTSIWSPEARYAHAMTHLGVADELGRTLLGGGVGDTQFDFERTWSYGHPSEGWSDDEPLVWPPELAYHSMAFLQLGYVVLFGGIDETDNPADETWVFDIFADELWIQQFANPSPPARAAAAMAHGGKGVAVLFGGDGDSALLDDTWVFRPEASLGITVTPTSGLIVTDAGGSATFDIAADTPPDDDVMVPLSVTDATEAMVPDEIWLPAGSTAPIAVTVTGLADGVIDGDIGFTVVTGDPESDDGRYDFLEADHVDDIAITSWDTDAARIEVSGDGQVIANGDNTPSKANDTDFGGSQTDTVIERTFEIANQGAVDLELTGNPVVDLNGSNDFSVSDQPSKTLLGAGESVDFTVRCRPSDTGEVTAVVSIANDDPDDDPFTFTVACSGGEAPEMVVLGNGQVIHRGDQDPSEAKHTVFPLVGAGPVVRTFIISNRGDEILLLHNGSPFVQIDHWQFHISSSPDGTIEPGETSSFDVTFERGAEDYVETTVTISNSDEDRDPYTFTIVGTVDGATEPGLRADAGDDQMVLVGSNVSLDGTGSHDADALSAQRAPSAIRPKAIVSYRWAFKVERYVENSPVYAFPQGSGCMATSAGFDTPRASFVADKEGTYVLILEVTNGLGETATDEVSIQVVHEFPEPDVFRFDRLLCGPVPFTDSITFGFLGDGLADSITVDVYDMVRQLVWNTSAINARSIEWDGRSSEGERLANGPYLAIIRISGNGNWYIEQRTLFLLR